MTRLDHDGNVSPWLHLADDLDLTVRFVDLSEDDVTLDMDDLERQLSGRTRVVAFPWASNAVGTITDAPRIVELAQGRALAWVDAVHYAAHWPIDVHELGADVLLCSPYKFFGPHLGLFYGRRELLEGWRPYKVRPAPDEPLGARFETGTLPHEALAGFNAAVAYVESVGGRASPLTSVASGNGSSRAFRTTFACTADRPWRAGWRLRAHGARDDAGGGRDPAGGAQSPSGGATTTPSRSCGGSVSRTARSASGSSTTTPPRRSIAWLAIHELV